MTDTRDAASAVSGLDPVATRLFVAADLAPGAEVALDADQAHRLRNVLRLQPGHRIALFNGRDGEWAAEIVSLTRRGGSVRTGERRRAQRAEPDLWLLFAPIKHGRIDYLAQKATELGCARLQPVMTAFTNVTRVNRDRLAANALEAAQQTGRLSVPDVLAAATLADVLADWPARRRLMLCDEEGKGAPIAEALARVSREEARGPWAVLIGPEGGFAGPELDALRKLPFVIPVSLGPRLLRADTAAVAALACWQSVLGDWSDTVPGA